MPQATIEYRNPFIRRLLQSETEPERDEIVDEFAAAIADASAEEREAVEAELVTFLGDNRTDRAHDLRRSYVPILLGALGSDGAYDALLERLPQEEDDVVLKWIVKVLVRDFDRKERIDAIAAKFDAERDGVIFVRQTIVRALAERVADRDLGDVAIRVLMDALCDRYAEVRWPAIRGLRRARAAEAVPRLEALARGMPACPELPEAGASTHEPPSDEERREAIEALAAIGDVASIDVLLEVLDDPDQADIVLVAAADAIATLGGKTDAPTQERVTTTLIERVVHEDRAVAAAATAAFRELLSEEAASVRLAQLGLECAEGEIGRIADAIRLVAPKPAIRYLERIEDARRDRARRLMAEIGGERVFENLGKLGGGAAWAIDIGTAALVLGPLAYLVLSLLRRVLADTPLSDAAIASLLSLPLLVFVASVIVAFPLRPHISRIRYLVSILLAFMFTAGMIGAISGGLWGLNLCDDSPPAQVGTAADAAASGQDDARSAGPDVCTRLQTEVHAAAVGPVTVLKGSYLPAPDSATAEWLVSLSRPPGALATAAAGDDVPPDPGAETTDDAGGGAAVTRVSGFGAPLWVLLLAVLGSGFLTIALIVHETGGRPNFTDQRDMRARVGGILQHQFFVLFAPFGAIFVYQALVETGAAGKPLTVALAALGAGASLNLLLNRAMKYMKAAVRVGGGDQGGSGGSAPGGDGRSDRDPTVAAPRGAAVERGAREPR